MLQLGHFLFFLSTKRSEQRCIFDSIQKNDFYDAAIVCYSIVIVVHDVSVSNYDFSKNGVRCEDFYNPFRLISLGQNQESTLHVLCCKSPVIILKSLLPLNVIIVSNKRREFLFKITITKWFTLAPIVDLPKRNGKRMCKVY